MKGNRIHGESESQRQIKVLKLLLQLLQFGLGNFILHIQVPDWRFLNHCFLRTLHSPFHTLLKLMWIHDTKSHIIQSLLEHSAYCVYHIDILPNNCAFCLSSEVL